MKREGILTVYKRDELQLMNEALKSYFKTANNDMKKKYRILCLQRRVIQQQENRNAKSRRVV